MDCGKIGYASPAAAYQVARRMGQRQTTHAFAYRCRVCHLWHLAHRTDRIERLRKQEKVKRDAKRLRTRPY